jgi:hypothetical protein
MKWLQSQWEQSSIISGLLALGIWGGIITLALQQAPIPDILYAGGMGVIGFFFGAKVGQQQGERAALIRRLNKEV